jgi:hypothetical protein
MENKLIKFGFERDCDGIEVHESVCLREWGVNCKTCKQNPNYYNTNGQLLIAGILGLITVPIYAYLLLII